MFFVRQAHLLKRIVNLRVGVRRSLSQVAVAQNEYHEENPMFQEWRKRDILKALRRVNPQDTAISMNLASDFENLVGSDALTAKEVVSLVTLYSRADEMDRATAIYERPRKESSNEDTMRVQTAYLHALTKHGELDNARSLFLNMENSLTNILDSTAIATASRLAMALLDSNMLEKIQHSIAANRTITHAPMDYLVAQIAIEGHKSGSKAAENALTQALDVTDVPLKASEYRALYQALCDVCVEKEDHYGVVRAAVDMKRKTLRPTEQAMRQAITAASAVEDTTQINEQLFDLFVAFNNGPKLVTSVIEDMLQLLIKQERFVAVTSVYRYVAHRRRPTQAMDDAFHSALKKLPRDRAIGFCLDAGITLPDRPETTQPFEDTSTSDSGS